MSMFMAAMRQELREKGRIDGFGGLSSAAWAQEVREYEDKLEADRQRIPAAKQPKPPEPAE